MKTFNLERTETFESCICIEGYVGMFCQFTKNECDRDEGCIKGNAICERNGICYCKFPYFGKNCSEQITCTSLETYCKSSCKNTNEGPKCIDTSTLAVPEEVTVCRPRRQAEYIFKMNKYADEQWMKTMTWMDSITMNLVHKVIAVLHPTIKVDFSCHNHFNIEFDSLYKLVKSVFNSFLIILGTLLGILILL